MEQFVVAWWQRWQAAAFQLFTPRQKWTRQERAIQVGDVVLLRGDGKLKKGEYKLGRVVELLPGEDGMVRTVQVSLWERRKRRGHPDTRALPMAVQRLAVLLPREEQWTQGVSLAL